jgi:hypothetical protein
MLIDIVNAGWVPIYNVNLGRRSLAVLALSSSCARSCRTSA